MNKVLAHALHNEEACDFLLTDGSFKDWIVTTAFYSAVHFVNQKMFPGQVPINGEMKHCERLGEYIRRVPEGKRCNSIHKETINLVWQVLTPIGADYEELHGLCHSARYENYNVSTKKAQKARSILDKIKQFCHDTSTDNKETNATTIGEEMT